MLSLNRLILKNGIAFAITCFFSVGPTLAALPMPWLNASIGSVGVAGTGNESGGTFTLTGSGADIWGTADAFQYTYQRLNGNTEIIARVSSLQNTNGWAKAGIMIRESLSPNSKHAMVVITPGNGVAFQSRDTTGRLSTTIGTAGIVVPRYLKLTRTGTKFAAYQSPDGLAWTQVGTTRTLDMEPVLFAGLALTSHSNTVLATATFTNVKFNAPPVLFVTGSTSLGSGDAAVKKRLETLGFAVTVKDGPTSVSADALGKVLVVISSTITSSSVADKFRAVAVPVLLWESALLDDMGMTGAVSGTDYGTTINQTQATIPTTACNRTTMYTAAVGYTDGCQDLAAGQTGTFAILKAVNTTSWGVPGPGATKIALEFGSTTKAVIFGYPSGSTMPGLTAPARRVFFFLGDLSATALTPRGQALFDNAVYWATSTKYSLTRNALVLNYTPTLISFGNQRLDLYGKTRWGWNDPMVLVRDYLADITEASGGYIRWNWAHYAEIPDHINAWVPILGGEQFNSATFNDIDYIDGYNIGITTGDWGAAGGAMPSGGYYSADYNKILDDYAVNAKVLAGQVHEVIVYGFPFAGFNESVMAGKTAYEVNGPVVYRAGIPNHIVMGLNYERGLSEALESFGHRAEWFLDRHTFKIKETVPYNPCYWPDFPIGDYCGGTRPATPVRNIYDRFSVVEGNVPGNAGVGAAHWAPNARSRQDEYNWALTNTAYSQADDWETNYPNLTGLASKRLVNVNEWLPMAQNGDAGRGFKKWWMQHMPRVSGHYKDATIPVNNGKLNNWWEYIFNFDKHPETQGP
jgi:hypothetical protein